MFLRPKRFPLRTSYATSLIVKSCLKSSCYSRNVKKWLDVFSSQDFPNPTEQLVLAVCVWGHASSDIFVSRSCENRNTLSNDEYDSLSISSASSSISDAFLLDRKALRIPSYESLLHAGSI